METQKNKGEKIMSIFGKKALSLEDILKGIESLSEEEKSQVLKTLQPEQVLAKNESDNETPDNESENVNEEATTQGEESESVEEVETETNESNDLEETSETESEEVGEEVETETETPMETPETETTEAVNNNYDELIAAQSARIDSLESQLTAFRETLEKVVENQDKQNFGLSPKADFNEDVHAKRMDSVLNGYAPRRAEQYK